MVRRVPRLRPLRADGGEPFDPTQDRPWERRTPVRYDDSKIAALGSGTPRHALLFDNGLGGFTPDGREYVMTIEPGQPTPAPWVNVMANATFGTLCSESGAAYTWSENAHEFRLTPWHNDPVSDLSGEAFYLRDEDSGHYWSPTPLPAPGTTPYTTRHGFGYSVFEHTQDGIHSQLWVYVALDSPIKFSVLKVRNLSSQPRRLSATGYVEWVLGDLRPKSTPYVVTEIDPTSGAVFARNPYNTEFAHRIGFFDVDDESRTVSGDRAEFIGRNGSLSHPAALLRTGAVRPGGGRLGCLRRTPGRFRAGRRAKIVRSSSGSAWPAAAARMTPATRCIAAAARRPRGPPWRTCGGTGSGPWAPCRSRRRTRRSIAWPTAGSSTKPWPAASGRAAAITSPAAPSASATSYRTCWR